MSTQTPTSIARSRIIKLLTDNPRGLTSSVMRSLVCCDLVNKGIYNYTLTDMRRQGYFLMSGVRRSTVYTLNEDGVHQHTVDGRRTSVPRAVRLPAKPVKSGVAWSVFQLMYAGAV